MKRVSRAIDHVADVMAILAAASLVTFFLLTIIEVSTRYFAGLSLTWAIELSELGLVYMTFLAAPWILKRAAHVKVELLLGYLNKTTQTWLGLIMSIVGAFVCGILVIYGIRVTIDRIQRGVGSPGYLELPTAFFSIIIPIACIVLTAKFLNLAASNAASLRAPKKEEGTARPPEIKQEGF